MKPPAFLPAASARLDLWLWCARMRRGRADCVALIEAGAVRLNRQPTEKPHAKVRVGDTLTLKLHGDVLVLRVRGLAERRGPAAAARLLYEMVEETPVPCTAGGISAYGSPAERAENAR